MSDAKLGFFFLSGCILRKKPMMDSKSDKNDPCNRCALTPNKRLVVRRKGCQELFDIWHVFLNTDFGLVCFQVIHNECTTVRNFAVGSHSALMLGIIMVMFKIAQINYIYS